MNKKLKLIAKNVDHFERVIDILDLLPCTIISIKIKFAFEIVTADSAHECLLAKFLARSLAGFLNGQESWPKGTHDSFLGPVAPTTNIAFEIRIDVKCKLIIFRSFHGRRHLSANIIKLSNRKVVFY